MPSNPMQRKIRNSFLLGILLTVVLVAIIGAIVYFLVIQPKLNEIKEAEEIVYVKVSQLKNDVESGKEIDSSMINLVELPKDNVPSNAIAVLPGDKNIAKVNLAKGTILTSSIIAQDEQELNNSLRYAEYNMITMPTTLGVGEYVDVRLRLPNGQDLVVISKKEIINIYDQTVGMNLTEEEILILNSAIVEAYIMTSSELYMSTYVEPGLQTAATYTYMPTAEVITLMNMDENIVGTARTALAATYAKEGTTTVRGQVNNSVNQYSTEDAQDNIKEKMQAQIEAAKKARQDYLSELEGY